eukprot:c7592_g1_i4.p1 GENE.c7592_g1_i4~~c7592_g1_i4.p1  ORF type:complete len:119 (+),score=22.61 c7592_g1_i4:128-484(+)
MHAQARTSTHAHRHSLFDLIWFDSTGPQKLGTVERTNGEHIVADNIQTPLHHAASNGHVELCRFLVENGANVNAACNTGLQTPLHKAAERSHTRTCEYLISVGAFVDSRDFVSYFEFL